MSPVPAARGGLWVCASRKAKQGIGLGKAPLSGSYGAWRSVSLLSGLGTARKRAHFAIKALLVWDSPAIFPVSAIRRGEEVNICYTPWLGNSRRGVDERLAVFWLLEEWNIIKARNRLMGRVRAFGFCGPGLRAADAAVGPGRRTHCMEGVAAFRKEGRLWSNRPFYGFPRPAGGLYSVWFCPRSARGRPRAGGTRKG